jgi:hypothetical protein
MFSDEFNYIYFQYKKVYACLTFFGTLEPDAFERKEKTFEMCLQISSGGINQVNIEVLA